MNCKKGMIILIITVILSFIIGETIDAITLSIIILVDVIIGTIEEYRARKDAESLLNMIKPTSIVIRDGKEIDITYSATIRPGISAIKAPFSC